MSTLIVAFPKIEEAKAVRNLLVRKGYEVAIPWTYFIESGSVKEYDCFGFAAVVNDNDGKYRKSWLKYMQGIADGKDPTQFEDMVLIKK